MSNTSIESSSSAVMTETGDDNMGHMVTRVEEDTVVSETATMDITETRGTGHVSPVTRVPSHPLPTHVPHMRGDRVHQASFIDSLNLDKTLLYPIQLLVIIIFDVSGYLSVARLQSLLTWPRSH